MDELIVLLMRSFGWSLEYTTELVKTEPVKRLNALMEELLYQKAVDDYRQAANSARIVATMASSKNHKYTIKDIIGAPPTREGTGGGDKLYDVAEKAGIKMPKGG